MRFACWITKATNIHSEYVILNAFFTAKVVTRTHLNVTFIRILPVLLLIYWKMFCLKQLGMVGVLQVQSFF